MRSSSSQQNPDVLINQILNVYLDHRQHNRYAKATKTLQLGLQRFPDNSDLHHHLGEMHQIQQDFKKAQYHYEKSLSQFPENSVALSNLGNIFLENKNLEAAIHCYQMAVQYQPEFADAYGNLGRALLSQGNADGAIACAEIAILLNQENILYRLTLIEAYHAKQDLEQARKLIGELLSIHPDNPILLYHFGVILYQSQDFVLAKKVFHRSTEELIAQYHALKTPEAPLYFTTEEASAINMYAFCCLMTCDWDNFNRSKPLVDRITREQLQDGFLPGMHPFIGLALIDDFTLQKELTAAYAHHYQNKLSPFKHKPNKKPKNKPINIGYISPDFYGHAVGYLINDLFSHHDRTRFKIFGYSLFTREEDPQQALIKRSMDEFRDISALDFQQAASIIHEDGIDILVDLAGYTRNAKPEILALQPAPLQCHFAGYPHTMAAPFIQYHINHSHNIPEALQTEYTEKLLLLPETAIARAFTERWPEYRRQDFHLPQHAFIYAYLGKSYRIDESVFTCWMTILSQTQNSVLWLNKEPAAQNQWLAIAKKHGIAPERLLFLPKQNLSTGYHQMADVWLDAFTLSSGTSSALCAWAELPVVTLWGNSPQARTGASYALAAGIPELVAQSAEDYCHLAVRLHQDPIFLTTLKEKLRTNKAISPLFQPKRFIQHLERGYQALWDNFCQGLPPQTFNIPPLEHRS